jgi:hypothetical protein
MPAAATGVSLLLLRLGSGPFMSDFLKERSGWTSSLLRRRHNCLLFNR